MRSAHDTTSPSGVAGAGRLQEWLRMPSSVSAHRFSGVEHDVGAPHRVVVAAGDVGRQGVLAGVAAGAVAAVVAEGDRLGQRDVEAEGPGDRRGHLGHLQGVGEPGALVVVGEHEHLGLAGQPAEGGGVEDAVAVALEARPPLVGLLGPARGRRRRRPGWPTTTSSSCSSSWRASRRIDARGRGPGVGVGDAHAGRARRPRPSSTPSGRPAPASNRRRPWPRG